MLPRSRWLGLLLFGCGIVATLSLAASGKLAWYVHPRSAWFTVLMAVVAAVVLVGGAALRAARPERTRPSGPGERGWRRRWRWVGSGAIALCAVGAMLILPPATLSPERAAQQSAGTSVTADPRGADAALLSGRPDDELSLRDWSVLARQQESSALAGRGAELLGFATPDDDDPDNVVVVTRFFITCCAVDAQAVGVPVYAPGWEREVAAGEWLSVTGTFAPNPSPASSWAAILLPEQLTRVDAPEDPYVG
ncbi:TIGR03943 family putative permease subunit [Leucobacter chromiireducens]|uniref:TIGR03943 family protein n=1 Tax=Leucobacter chromiireducens subsp. chromiireducens TaxID=660067 RepID=A0ABS1SP91_9MICO|nr:TIGR03943 family protein [Leucobacter chromiireducens]MBL3689799.1 TIGR03943 family protein [Leucobacter chromiireducens subsp. chromiireducens]